MDRLKHKAWRLLGPRLGVLHQYTPRPLLQITDKENWEAFDIDAAPRVSLVTPSFRQGHYLGETIRSVLGQNYHNLEYFIEDGGSDDNTLEVLKTYESQLSGWISEPDKGQSHAINKGFKRTSGDLMGWLNSDDLLLPGAIETVVRYFADHPEVDVVYGNRIIVDENGFEIGRWIMPGHDSSILSWADYVPQETLFWRREIWEKVGGQIDESFRFAMDWDLLVRFRDAGAKFAHIPRFMGAFRIHQQQKTSAEISEIGFQEMNRIRQRIHGHVPTQQQIHKAMVPFLLKHIWVDLKWRIFRGA
ncbi:beta-1,6-glucanase [Rhizobium sp. AAP43]|nr:beta-1,6-glucanase [Rhizobium sp. AAP43]